MSRLEQALEQGRFVVTAEMPTIDGGGMDEVRFRGQVKPGCRLVLVAKGLKFQSRKAVFNVQGFVAGTMVFHADITGIALNRTREG